MEVNNRTPEALARLPREELRRMLAEELHKDTQQIDAAFVRSLLVELRARGADPVFVDDDAVTAACEKFQQDTVQMQKNRRGWYHSWMLKVASVILVLGILFFALPAAAEAGQLKDVLGWWTDDVFQFIIPGEKPLMQEYIYKTDHPGLQELYDTVTELGIAQQIVPRKLSIEFELTELKTIQFHEDTSIHACLASKTNNMLYTAVIHNETVVLQHEKVEESVSIWDLAGIEHYVISNTKEHVITWVVDNIECTVITDCSEEDVYDFIKSIYTSEG